MSQKPFKLVRSALREAGACNLDFYFDSHPNAKHGIIVYPDGWTEEETQRLAREKPIGLYWLAKRGLIPVTPKRAKEVLKNVHGHTSTRKFMEQNLRARGKIVDRPAKPAAPAAPAPGAPPNP